MVIPNDPFGEKMPSIGDSLRGNFSQVHLKMNDKLEKPRRSAFVRINPAEKPCTESCNYIVLFNGFVLFNGWVMQLHCVI